MASEDDQPAGTAKKATGHRQPAKRSTSKKATKSPAKKSAAATSTAKKSAAATSTAKKSAAATSTAKKSSAATSTAKKSSAAKNARSRSGPSGSGGRASTPEAASRPRPGATEIARSAIAEVAGMTGHDIESITSLERTDEGWTVQVQAVELRRVPSTTDVLATYEVLVDSQGELQGYRRVGRYSRGDTRSDQ